MNKHLKFFLVIIIALPVLSIENTKKNNTAYFSLPDTNHNVDIDMISKTSAVRTIATTTGVVGIVLIKNGIENSIKNNKDGTVSLNLQGLISIISGLILTTGSLVGIKYSNRIEQIAY